MSRASYPSDLTEQQWAILEPLVPPAKPGGHPRTTDIREVINAILDLDRTGGQWRALSHDFPPWSTVWSYFRTWCTDGTWQRIHTALREQTRVKHGREPQFGARPLKRVIQREVENRIARGILDGTIRDGDRVEIDAQDGKLVIEPVREQVQEEAHAH
jgi:putative transposase